MARPASGQGVLESAREAIAKARNIEELRIAQAVVLPLAFGLTLSQTAQAIGISTGWTCRLRRRFERIATGKEPPKLRKGGRHRENLTLEQEAAFLAPYLEAGKTGGVLVVPPIKRALDAHLGKSVALSSVYRMLHRHGWRKLAPDKVHPQSDSVAQEEWKKNSRKRSRR